MIDFTRADDLATYYRSLRDFHAPRIRTHLMHQSLWEMPIRSTETERTIFLDNEPWTATRLIVSLIDAGELSLRGSIPSNDWDNEKRKQAVSDAEELLKAHFCHVDVEMFRRRRGTYIRQYGYLAAVYGWHAGINLVTDLAAEWPIHSDLWSPLDTFPDMDTMGLVHVTRMNASQIERTFGSKRMGGVALDGYEFEIPTGAQIKPDTRFDLLSFWDEDINCCVVLTDQKAMWVKRPTEHKIGHNPAWCNPVDAPPFRCSASDGEGNRLDVPDNDSGLWLATYGQSPMHGYSVAYRYMSELANQVADVVERWASPIVIAKTKDGRYVEIDLTKGGQNTVDLSTIVEIIAPPKFPADDRAWMAFVQTQIEKGSFSKVAYGVAAAMESQNAFEQMRRTSNMIVEPLVKQAEEMYEYSVLSILRQLDQRKGQYKKKSYAVRTKDKDGSVYDFIDLSKLPKGVYMTASLKGAGVPQDKFQALLAVTNAVNAKQKVLPLETLLDEYLERDDAPRDVARVFWEDLANNPEVKMKASPIITLLHVADEARMKGTPRGNDIADAFYALALEAVKELKGAVGPQQQPQAPQMGAIPPGLATPGTLPGAIPPTVGPVGPPEGAPPPFGPPPNLQIAGAAPVGAPPPGSIGPSTGPDAVRGMLMQLAARRAGLPGAA